MVYKKVVYYYYSNNNKKQAKIAKNKQMIIEMQNERALIYELKV